jgi:hypothetical protein
LFKLDADCDRVTEPEPAELRADARLDRADSLGIGVSGRHSEVLPDRRELFLADAEQIDPLTARDLDHGQLVLVRGVGDPPQLVWGHDAATDARNDAERAVVLNVRVDAIVDVAGVPLLTESASLDLRDEVGEPRLAGAAIPSSAAAVAQL